MGFSKPHSRPPCQHDAENNQSAGADDKDAQPSIMGNLLVRPGPVEQQNGKDASDRWRLEALGQLKLLPARPSSLPTGAASRSSVVGSCVFAFFGARRFDSRIGGDRRGFFIFGGCGCRLSRSVGGVAFLVDGVVRAWRGVAAFYAAGTNVGPHIHGVAAVRRAHVAVRAYAARRSHYAWRSHAAGARHFGRNLERHGITKAGVFPKLTGLNGRGQVQQRGVSGRQRESLVA